MRITSVTPIPVTLPTEREPMSFLFVRVETDNGLVGWGEACDSYGCSFAGVLATAVTDAFAPLLVGQDIDSVELHAQRLRAWTRRRLGDDGVAGPARSAIEVALWDVVAQSAGRSVSHLLGRVRDRVAVYASGGFLEEGDVGWHLEQLEPLLSRGVTMVKLRVGPSWASDIATLAAVREALDPTIEMMIDGSEIFTLPTALEVAARLHDLGVRWFEEPIPQPERAAIERLVKRSPVPIAYGEHLYCFDDALDALRRHQLSVLQPDATTCGGITEARRIAQLGASFGARVVPHVCAGPIALAANLHVAASVATIRAIEYPPSLLGAWRSLGRGALVGVEAIVDGMLPVPAGPGLGVELAEDTAAAHGYHPPRRLAGVRDTQLSTVSSPLFPDRFAGDR